MNKHIYDSIKNYITLEVFPEYALLVSGKWGVGKTFFINNYLESESHEKIKFIKVSLFGIKSVEEIHKQIIFQLVGKEEDSLSNSLIKIGTSILDSFGKKINLGIHDIPIEQILKTLTKKLDKEIVFIFDDLERITTNIEEILGYINILVERLHLKIILLANEMELVKKDKYKEFKEKIIGKTFLLKQDFATSFATFIELISFSKTIIVNNKTTIEDIFITADYHNLRHIRQSLLDFEYFTKNIDEEYLKHQEFVSILVNNFFAISIELKSGNLTKEELSKRQTILWDFSDNKDKEKTNMEKIYEKYNIQNNPLFDGKVWVKILLDNSIQKEELNELISNLSFFLEQREKERPSWIRIWYYRQLSDEDFIKNLNDVVNKFKNCEYDIPEHFIHVIALLIFFSKNQLCKLRVEEIKSQVQTCINDKYQYHQNWKNRLFEDGIMRFNNTGLGYIDKDDKDFKDIFSKIIEKNKSIYKEEETKKQHQSLNKFLESIKELDENFLMGFLLKDYEFIPILSNLDHNEFTKILTNIENNNISMLGEILYSRYSEDKSLDGQLSYCYLIDELEFWKGTENNLNKYLQNADNQKLKTFLLKEFNIHLVKKVIKKMESCLETQSKIPNGD